MSDGARGFNVRDLTQHAKAEIGRVNINVGKVLPATATGNLFTVAGTIVITGLYAVVSTVFGVTGVSPTLGFTPTGGVASNAALAAAPSAPYVSTAVGSAVVMPTTLGGVLPAAVVASASVSSAVQFTCQNGTITITTNATNAGALTWVMSWMPVFPKNQVATVTNA
jgi:hypothetical protein